MNLRRLLRSPSGSFPNRQDFPYPAGCGLGFRFYSRGLRGPYEELGVSEGATPAEVKQAYHRRSLECHPDLHNNDGKEFMRVTEAYKMVMSGRGRVRKVGVASSASMETRIFQGPRAFFWVSIMLGVVLFAYPLNMYMDNRSRVSRGDEPSRFVEPTRDAVKRERIAAILLERQRRDKDQK